VISKLYCIQNRYTTFIADAMSVPPPMMMPPNMMPPHMLGQYGMGMMQHMPPLPPYPVPMMPHMMPPRPLFPAAMATTSAAAAAAAAHHHHAAAMAQQKPTFPAYRLASLGEDHIRILPIFFSKASS